MTAATYAKINAEISKHGVQICKGNGYHYFADLDDAPEYNADRIASVYDGGFLRSMSLEDWIAHVEQALAE